MQESKVEKRLKAEAEKRGGKAIKIKGIMFNGMPDRLVLLPEGRIGFAELKTTGKKLSPRQEYVYGLLTGLGFMVRRIDSVEGIAEFFKDLTK